MTARYSACKSSLPTPAAEAKMLLSPTLDQQVARFVDAGRPETMDELRAMGLAPLVQWIGEQARAGETADLLFVCTHNSRRSQMGQAWARAAALHLGLDHVRTWSGGTEATAFNPRAVRALRTHGFEIEATEEALSADNQVYELRYGPTRTDHAFSKVYADPFNPQQGFAAVMVCSSADASCPAVEGAELRVSAPYLDPKISDGGPEETATYLAKSEEIGREMSWLMLQVAAELGP